MPRILLNLNDTRGVFTEEDHDRLSALGETLTFNPKTDAPDLFRERLAAADVMLTCWGSRALTLDDFPEGSPKSLLVAHAAGSVRGMVPKELLKRGVRLTQGAPAIALAVAHYTVGLTLMALRQAYYRMSVLRSGSKDYSQGTTYRDLQGLTFGIVGLSRVGTLVIPLLKPFEANVIAYDPYCTPEKAAALGVELVPDLDDLIRRSDVLSLHAPVTEETKNLIDTRRIGLLRPGSVVINTARAALVDQDALFARAMTGEIQAYLDVTTPEPLPPDHPAWQSSHIFITPHIAGPTQQSLRRMADYAISEMERYLSGQPLQYEVTYDRYDILA
jgi:phosphoglycerate dehydrogenase-like enzyme